MLGRMEERNDAALAEQRHAFSSLKAIKAGKSVPIVRTGHRVRDYLPGSVPQTSSVHGHKSNTGIQIYQVYCKDYISNLYYKSD